MHPWMVSIQVPFSGTENDFNELCGITDNKENIFVAEITFMVIGVGIEVTLLGLSITGFL